MMTALMNINSWTWLLGLQHQQQTPRRKRTTCIAMGTHSLILLKLSKLSFAVTVWGMLNGPFKLCGDGGKLQKKMHLYKLQLLQLSFSLLLENTGSWSFIEDGKTQKNKMSFHEQCSPGRGVPGFPTLLQILFGNIGSLDRTQYIKNRMHEMLLLLDAKCVLNCYFLWAGELRTA